MTANPDLGIRFWTPSSVFVALPPLRQPAPPPAIRGDSVAALALERTQSPMVFSTTRDGPQAQKGRATGILEENYSPIAHGMVLSNPLVAEVAGHYGDSSFFPVFGGKL